MAEEKTKSKAKSTKAKTTKSEATTEAKAEVTAPKAAVISTVKTKPDFKESVLKMWSLSLILAALLVFVIGVQSFYVREEAEIRRESYLANLEQLYQQELQACAAAGQSFGDEEAPTGESAQQCIERVNQDGQYANLVRKWGGEDRLQTEL